MSVFTASWRDSVWHVWANKKPLKLVSFWIRCFIQSSQDKMFYLMKLKHAMLKIRRSFFFFLGGGGRDTRCRHRSWTHLQPTLPYFGKRKQVTIVPFLIKEYNVHVTSTDLTSMEYHDVLPNKSLRRMSIDA